MLFMCIDRLPVREVEPLEDYDLGTVPIFA